MDSEKEYLRWLRNASEDNMEEALKSMREDEIEDSFYKNLSFGTGGLRGIIGAGTNRMNVYTVGKATQGVAAYLLRNYEVPSVVIGYDSRVKSEVFARTAACVFAANGVKVHIWSVLNPVPTVSFATRYLKASAGIIITASHNPAKYNGYKVYAEDGCQITTEAAAEIQQEIDKVDIFTDMKNMDYENALKREMITYIPDVVLDAFIDEVKKQSVLFGEKIDKNTAIVYSPLNGT